MSTPRIQYLLQQYKVNNCSDEEMEELFYYLNIKKGKKRFSFRGKSIKRNSSFIYVNQFGELVTEDSNKVRFLEKRRNKNNYRKLGVVIGVMFIVLLVVTILSKLD